MVYSYFADLVVVLHACFVLFALLGGFLVLWKPLMAWCHIPAVLWAAGIEFLGWICPLTPLENMLRARGGDIGYATGFVEHYIMPLLYPAQLTKRMQIGFGLIVLGINFVIYWCLWAKNRKAEIGTEHRGTGS
jgi:hypothetical protein